MNPAPLVRRAHTAPSVDQAQEASAPNPTIDAQVSRNIWAQLEETACKSKDVKATTFLSAVPTNSSKLGCLNNESVVKVNNSTAVIHAHTIAVNTQQAKLVHYTVGQSPDAEFNITPHFSSDQTQVTLTPHSATGNTSAPNLSNVLRQAIESKQGLFQFTSEKAHRGQSLRETTIIDQLLRLQTSDSDAFSKLFGDDYTITSFTESPLNHLPDDVPSERHKRYMLELKDKANNTIYVPITQIGMPFKDKLLTQDSIRQANSFFQAHIESLGENRDAALKPMIMSYAGQGRNATLMVYHQIASEMSSWSNLNLQEKTAKLSERITTLISEGRKARGPRFVHSEAQLNELYSALFTIIKDLKPEPAARVEKPLLLTAPQVAKHNLQQATVEELSKQFGWVLDELEHNEAGLTPTIKLTRPVGTQTPGKIIEQFQRKPDGFWHLVAPVDTSSDSANARGSDITETYNRSQIIQSMIKFSSTTAGYEIECNLTDPPAQGTLASEPIENQSVPIRFSF